MTMTSVIVPQLDTVTIETPTSTSIKLKGTITQKETVQELDGFFRAIHQNAVASNAESVVVDVSQLTFVNSMALHLFVDWATWLKNENGHRYKLRLRMSRRVTWQMTSAAALTILMADVLTVERVD